MASRLSGFFMAKTRRRHRIAPVIFDYLSFLRNIVANLILVIFLASVKLMSFLLKFINDPALNQRGCHDFGYQLADECLDQCFHQELYHDFLRQYWLL